jgi:hypothetical protein
MGKLTWTERFRLGVGVMVATAWAVGFIIAEVRGQAIDVGLTALMGIVTGGLWSSPIFRKIGEALSKDGAP